MPWYQAVRAGFTKAQLWFTKWRRLQSLRILEQSTWQRWREARLSHQLNWRQLLYLPRFLTPIERRIFFVAGLLVIASSVFLFIRFYTVYLPDKPLSGGEYIEGVVGNPRYPHPFFAPLNPVDIDLANLLYRGLVKLGSEGNIILDAAKSYAVSTDGLVYDFVLRDNLKFHDDKPITVDDVVWTYQQLKDTRWQSPLQISFQNVEVTQTGEWNLEFKLTKPSTSFLSSLTVGILPAYLWRDIAPDTARTHELMRQPVGSGVWKVKEIVSSTNGTVKSYNLVRADAGVTPPYLESLTLRFYSNWDELAKALEDRSVDGAAFIPAEFKTEVEKQHHFNFVQVALPQYVAVFLQIQKDSPLDDVRVRKALSSVIDRRQLIKVILNNEAKPITEVPLPGFSEEATITAPDLALAQANISAAGWVMPKSKAAASSRPDSAQVFRQKGKVVMHLKLTTTDLSEYVAVAKFLARQWEDLGVQVEVEIVPAASIVQDIIQPRKYEALLYGQILGADFDPYPFWHSSQEVAPGLNLTNYLNKGADQLLEEARHQIYQDGRRTRYGEWLKAMSVDMPAVFLYRPQYWYAVDQRVRGVDDLQLVSPGSRVWAWENWYKRSRKTLFSRE